MAGTARCTHTGSQARLGAPTIAANAGGGGAPTDERRTVGASRSVVDRGRTALTGGVWGDIVTDAAGVNVVGAEPAQEAETGTETRWLDGGHVAMGAGLADAARWLARLRGSLQTTGCCRDGCTCGTHVGLGNLEEVALLLQLNVGVERCVISPRCGGALTPGLKDHVICGGSRLGEAARGNGWLQKREANSGATTVFAAAGTAGTTTVSCSCGGDGRLVSTSELVIGGGEVRLVSTSAGSRSRESSTVATTTSGGVDAVFGGKTAKVLRGCRATHLPSNSSGGWLRRAGLPGLPLRVSPAAVCGKLGGATCTFALCCIA